MLFKRAMLRKGPFLEHPGYWSLVNRSVHCADEDKAMRRNFLTPVFRIARIQG